MLRHRLALLATVLLVSPAIASDPPIRVKDCGDTEAAELRKAVAGAYGIAQNCLIGQGLNPALGAKVKEIVDGQRILFDCQGSTGPSDGTAGSTGDDGEGLGMEVGLVNWPPPEFAHVRGHAEYIDTAFHELIHASDPKSKLSIGQDLHNVPVTADPVYGCEIACRGNVGGRLYVDGLDVYEASGKIIPEKTWACAGDPKNCDVVRKMAWLCASGKAPAIDKRRAKNIRAVLCLETRLKESLGKDGKPACVGEVCDDVLKGFVRDAQSSVEPDRSETRALYSELYPVVDAATSGSAAKLTSRGKALFTALQKAKSLKPCLK